MSKTLSKRYHNAKNEKFHGNVHKRGMVPEGSLRPKEKYPVGPVVLGFFVFVVVGSALLQIIKTATTGMPH
ncbi:ribosome associated membrane protein RAMP4 [Pycnococcus provasolii]